MVETTVFEGLVWPKDDRDCRKVIMQSLDDLSLALSHTKGRALALQAGGNCGVWARHLAGIFDAVVTAEPDPVNFYCLTQNVPANVTAHFAALGKRPGNTTMRKAPGNCGAHQLEPDSLNAGETRVITIDGLGIDPDLICLDVEGFELLALMGAAETLARCHPVIQLEDKGLSEQFGHPKGAVIRWLKEAHGYKVVGTVGRDVVLA